MERKEKFNQREYDRTHTTRYQLKLNNETDRDIIEKLSSVKSKQGYIKECIRKDLSAQNQTNTLQNH